MDNKPKQQEGRVYYGWFVVLSSFLIYFSVIGSRGAFGNFIPYFIEHFHWTIKEISIAASLALVVNALAQPVVGYAVNRWGPRKTILWGTLFYGASTASLSLISELWQLYLIFGVLMGLFWSTSSNVSNASLVSRWFVKKRGLALGLSTSGMATGIFVVVPLSMYLILQFGWRPAFATLGFIVLGISLPLAFKFMKNNPADIGLFPDGNVAANPGDPVKKGNITSVDTRRISLRQAMRTRPFWHLLGGFFVCGFTALMSSTFLVPMAIHKGFHPMVAAQAAGLLGGASALGIWIGGYVSDFIGRKRPLAAFYFLRGVGFLILLAAHNEPTLYLAAFVIGFGNFGTAPLTSGLVADIYGVLSMGTILGLINMSHQMGGAISSYITGAVVQATGSYEMPFLLGVLLLFAASILSITIKEKRLEHG
ncbi:MAG: MFS transporter [Dehalococcoidia bacterium]|nr:MFS transporter [Dehalococcoidia bacterium]MDZ4247182.1 MFS transporter [Dehalococcoidia bacterium]